MTPTEAIHKAMQKDHVTPRDIMDALSDAEYSVIKKQTKLTEQEAVLLSNATNYAAQQRLNPNRIHQAYANLIGGLCLIILDRIKGH